MSVLFSESKDKMNANKTEFMFWLQLLSVFYYVPVQDYCGYLKTESGALQKIKYAKIHLSSGEKNLSVKPFSWCTLSEEARYTEMSELNCFFSHIWKHS